MFVSPNWKSLREGICPWSLYLVISPTLQNLFFVFDPMIKLNCSLGLCLRPFTYPWLNCWDIVFIIRSLGWEVQGLVTLWDQFPGLCRAAVCQRWHCRISLRSAWAPEHFSCVGLTGLEQSGPEDPISFLTCCLPARTLTCHWPWGVNDLHCHP